jgi:hypothetical protein
VLLRRRATLSRIDGIDDRRYSPSVEKLPVTPTSRPYFLLSAVYLVILLGGGFVYVWSEQLQRAIPSQLGPIPIGVAWWGAVGAVTISLYGVFFHSAHWDPSFDYWHISRPLLGSVLAMVAYMIFVVVVDATGAQAKTSGNLVYYLIAFLVGYREATFQMLIQRATDVLFTSTDKPTKPGGSPPA